MEFFKKNPNPSECLISTRTLDRFVADIKDLKFVERYPYIIIFSGKRYRLHGIEAEDE
jgi:hypothetical protein